MKVRRRIFRAIEVVALVVVALAPFIVYAGFKITRSEPERPWPADVALAAERGDGLRGVALLHYGPDGEPMVVRFPAETVLRLPGMGQMRALTAYPIGGAQLLADGLANTLGATVPYSASGEAVEGGNSLPADALGAPIYGQDPNLEPSPSPSPTETTTGRPKTRAQLEREEEERRIKEEQKRRRLELKERGLAFVWDPPELFTADNLEGRALEVVQLLEKVRTSKVAVANAPGRWRGSFSSRTFVLDKRALQTVLETGVIPGSLRARPTASPSARPRTTAPLSRATRSRLRVEVLNAGGTAGAARKAADALRAAGYRIARVGNFTGGARRDILVYYRKDARAGTDAGTIIGSGAKVSKMPASFRSTADVLILIGRA